MPDQPSRTPTEPPPDVGVGASTAARAAPSIIRSSVSVREVRRGELDRYLELVATTAGEFDRRVGLLDTSDRQLRSLSSVGFWLVLRTLRLIGRSPVRMLVADDDGALVGTTMVIVLGPWAYVAAVGVRDDHRRRGIAQELVRRAEEIGLRSRRRRMVLEADSENRPAVNLYHRLGWEPRCAVEWWQLPSSDDGRPAPSTRSASIRERRFAHAAAVRTLGTEFPSSYIHPCELACRGAFGRPATLASGPVGEPSLVVRCAARPGGGTGYLLPVATGDGRGPDEAQALEAGRLRLLRQGTTAVFVPVLGGESPLGPILTSLGGERRARSEVWCKDLPFERSRGARRGA